MYYSRHSPSDFLYVVAVLANCYNPCNSGEESGRKSQKYIFTSHNPSKGTEATLGHWTDRTDTAEASQYPPRRSVVTVSSAIYSRSKTDAT